MIPGWVQGYSQPYFDKSWPMDEIELSEVSKPIERIRHPIYENNIENQGRGRRDHRQEQKVLQRR
jgi:hypothetical protein